MSENEIRLNAENIRLFEENNFLREMLNRLIPIPVNHDIEYLDNRLVELNKRIIKLEERIDK